jgi:PKD repeat protein
MKTTTIFFLALFSAMLLSYSSGNAQCQASFTWTAMGNYTIAFTNTSTPMNVNTMFTWSFGDSQFGYTTNPVHTYPGAGTYIVSLAMYDSLQNCQSAISDTIQVPTVLGVNEEASNLSVSIAPNPTSNLLLLTSGPELIGKSYQVMDVTARVILSGKFESNFIDISSLGNGTYILQIENGNGEFTSRRFIKN